jgi:hypothetical protein
MLERVLRIEDAKDRERPAEEMIRILPNTQLSLWTKL